MSVATDSRRPIRLSSRLSTIFGACANFVQHLGARHLPLAVLVDGSLPVERILRADRRHDERSKAITGPVAILLIGIGLFAFLFRLT
jgi:hypothetical protein